MTWHIIFKRNVIQEFPSSINYFLHSWLILGMWELTKFSFYLVSLNFLQTLVSNRDSRSRIYLVSTTSKHQDIQIIYKVTTEHLKILPHKNLVLQMVKTQHFDTTLCPWVMIFALQNFTLMWIIRQEHEIQDMDNNFAVTEIWDIKFFFKQRI
jgi:hypothetical protein